MLWYRQPAAAWTEALPIGNGRLGAMVFGGIARERLQLNEGTLWAGGPYDPVSPAAKAALPEVRALIFAGRYREAAALADRAVMARLLKQMPYQALGDLSRIYAKAGADGIGFHLAAIPDSFNAALPEPFNRGYMTALYEVGLRLGREGYPWMNAPPGVGVAASR